MLLGDQRKKQIINKLMIIVAIMFLPMVFMFISSLLVNNGNIIIIIVVSYFILATSMALYLLSIMKKEKTALKGMKVKVISLEYKLNLEIDHKGTKQQFYSKEYYKDGSFQSDLLPVLDFIDEDEIYEIVIITAYYYSVIKNQYGQSYLIHTNNLKLID